MKLLVSLVAVAALAIPAHAGALKAHLECAPDGGKPLKAKQKVALDKDIACAIVVDGGAVPSDAQVAIDARVATPIGAVKGHKPRDVKSTDGKRFAADAFKAGAEFLHCGGLQIDASIAQGSKTLWSTSLAVAPACSPAKSVTGSLACAADSADKGYVSFPGNGDKIAAELADGITCTITGPKDDPSAHYGVLQIEGATAAAAMSVLTPQQGSKAPIVFNQFIGTSVPKCKPFVVDAAILDSDGGVMWQAKLPIAQTCKPAQK